MTEKTPTSILSEFCVQNKVTPLYNPVSQESDPRVPIFTISVTVLDYVAKGSGRSKADAKHDASQKLIDILAQLDQFKVKLNSSSSKSNERCALEVFNAVGALIMICQQRKIQEPDFSETSITGEDHKREFTIRCNVAQFQSTGIGLSKKDAKRIAATEMIKLINSSDSATLSDSNSSLYAADAVGALITFCRQCNFNLPTFDTVEIGGKDHQKEFKTTCTIDKCQRSGVGFQKKEAKQKAAMEMLNYLSEIADMDTSSGSESLSICSNVPWVLPIEELPSVEDVLAEYRRLKSQHYVRPVSSGIRCRKNFFLKLPEENRNQAIQLLTHKYIGVVSPKNIVDAALLVLGLKYKIDTKSCCHIFSLVDSGYDCVLIGQSYDIYDKVAAYLKVMLNVPNSLDVSHLGDNILEDY